MDQAYEFLGYSVLNCVYAGALGIGVIYTLFLLVFQGIGEVADGIGDLFSFLDGGADIHMDIGDVHGDGAGISLLAVTIFISAFGAFGLAGTGFGAGPGGSLVIATLGGVVFGGLGQAFFLYILSPTTSSIVTQSKLEGMTAEVTTPIPDGGIGQISLVVQGSRINYSARSLNEGSLKRGTEVRIERIIGSVATVVPTSEFEA